MAVNSTLASAFYSQIPDAVAVYYPMKNGDAISDVTLSDVALAPAESVALDGILVTAAPNAPTTILITDRAGVTRLTINVAAFAAGAFNPFYLPLGPHGFGMRVPMVNVAGTLRAGFGIKTSVNTLLCTAFWRLLQRRG